MKDGVGEKGRERRDRARDEGTTVSFPGLFGMAQSPPPVPVVVPFGSLGCPLGPLGDSLLSPHLQNLVS